MAQDVSKIFGPWEILSYGQEVIATGERYNQFGDASEGYLGYASGDWMYAIFTRRDRMVPSDVVPTDEEAVQLIGSMVAYAGTYTPGDKRVIHHIDICWNQSWTGTDQVRYFEPDGAVPTITTAPYRSYSDGQEGRSIPVWTEVQGL
jgi:hypothetical protein